MDGLCIASTQFKHIKNVINQRLMCSIRSGCYRTYDVHRNVELDPSACAVYEINAK
ncbi:hypothetical protein Mapa_011759 [Marchantia paleacea]|nr:hypothetical protein Mapa_011759 [Marchantia paleacea]